MKYVFALCCLLTTAVLFPGLAAAEWHTDFEKAKAESLKTKRPIYILFTNSDAAACISFDRVIFREKKFLDYADKNLVLMKADFPVAIHLQPKKISQQNKELRTKFGISLFPTALLLDANGELYIDFVKADGSAEKHRRKMNEIMDFNAPKRYSEYLDGFVKKYAPPEPPAPKASEAKKETKNEAKKPAKKPARKPAEKPQNAAPAGVSIPDENAGKPLVPLDPEGNFQDWLRSSLAEEAAEKEKEAEEAKEIVEEAMEALEKPENAQENSPNGVEAAPPQDSDPVAPEKS